LLIRATQTLVRADRLLDLARRPGAVDRPNGRANVIARKATLQALRTELTARREH
jgi:hypothetical protein